MTDDGALPDTVGTRADAHGRRIAASHALRFPWAAGFAGLAGRLLARSEGARRFDRVEATPFGAPIPAAAPPPLDGVPAPVPLGAPYTGDPPARTPGWARPDRTVGEALSQESPTLLPDEVHARVQRSLGAVLPPIGVHRDGPADTLAGAHQADAVTVGSDIYFRQGRYRPDDPAGFALLVHEATHVLVEHQHRAGAPMSRDTEETAARRAEAAALGGSASPAPTAAAPTDYRLPPTGAAVLPAALAPWPPTGPHPHPGPSAQRAPRPGEVGATVFPATVAPGSRPGEVPAAGGAGHPVPAAARTDRDLTEPGPPMDLNALRRSLLDEVKQMLRSDFERGA